MIDYSIRTYLLIHQVSIKLILCYKEAYRHIYLTVVDWIQNPFIADYEKWPIEEVLIAANLVCRLISLI